MQKNFSSPNVYEAHEANIKNPSIARMNSSILLIYTGGTIGMMEDLATGSLMPFDFKHLQDYVPELTRFKCNIESVSFDEPIDSSDVDIATWQQIARMVEVNYEHYDGFVVLHGTDTMAYSASALSFMLRHLAKPVIFTGSQLPIGKLRTDGKENLITAIEIASARKNNEPVVQEVAIYFESQLYRGNRTHKYNTENFDAFQSANFPSLADAGVHIFYRLDLLLRPNGQFAVQLNMDNNVAVLKIFPAINTAILEGILNIKNLRGLILETFGAGNFPQRPELHAMLQQAIAKGVVIVNVSQCNKGFVEQGRYETSHALQKMGVIGGFDMTTEAALTKLMFLLGHHTDNEWVKQQMMTSMCGELTSYSSL
jgi:L-asparaginase